MNLSVSANFDKCTKLIEIKFNGVIRVVLKKGFITSIFVLLFPMKTYDRPYLQNQIVQTRLNNFEDTKALFLIVLRQI